ncbi:MAG: hypothetical protein Q4F98_06640 [Lachnospiraceae bacterium]|nr:hypothetical protein [Lachnospiraceae bacterium]
MDNLFVIREKMRELYASHSRIFDKAIQFVLALVTFYLINANVGFLKAAASPAATLALSVICTFFPLIITVLLATALILAHMFAASISALAVTLLIFLVMYIFYLRLTPKMSVVVLLTPVAFALNIPCIIPIALGLIATPISLVAVICGTIVYYMMAYVKKAAPGMESSGKAKMMMEITAYIKQVFDNKEMWIMIAATIICLFLVYIIHRQAVDHAWKIAIVSGAVANIIIVAIGDVAMGVHTSYAALIIGNLFAVVIGLALELFFFSVDYAKSENLQYEDDEYYYYVKAVPKLSVAAPEKTVKRINERNETEIMDTSKLRKGKQKNMKKHDMDEVNQLLLTQSIKKDLNMK